MVHLDRTHAPDAKSWVESANDADSDFPLQNLPFCAFRRRGDGASGGGATRLGVGIGTAILDLAAAHAEGLLDALPGETAAACLRPELNELMALGPVHWRGLRHHLFDLLDADGSRAAEACAERLLVAQTDATFAVPARIGDYTDFSASFHHGARTRAARGRTEADPAIKFYLPAAYHGRSSSIVISGTPIVRPRGMIASDGDAPLAYAPCKELDYELEFAFYVGPGTVQGQRVSIDEAEGHIFGCSLMNDWSGRDIQLWEGPRLGPYLSKSFATTVGPWVVTLDALAPFRMTRNAFSDADPPPPAHLCSAADREAGGLDITFEAFLASEKMRRERTAPARVCESNLRDVYYSIFQMLVHQTSNGCNLRSGDLIATGTVSGPTESAAGCLLELARGEGRNLAISADETRRFLEDGDEVVFRARATSAGCRSIGFGECAGRILADR